jgi:hypothetical protein
MLSRLFVLLVCLGEAHGAMAVDWVRAGVSTNQTVWGIRKGLLWAVAPGGFRSGEPRGLIRLGYPVLPDGGYDLINFIAVEPVVRGRRGFSELEGSQLDGVPGKRIWAEDPGGATATSLVPGTLRKRSGGYEGLEVPLRLEKFDNGAHVRLVARQRDGRPGELALSVFQEPDSAPLDYCILTATMGNMARTRLLWLKNQRVSSLDLYRDYKQTGFAPHQEYPLSDLPRTADGGLLIALSNDEDSPASVFPFPNSELWHYAGAKVTQYWAKPPGAFHDDLRLAVNARFTYWRSARPIPGGVAFENFELRERFYEGQTFVFGITRRTPEELGMKR